MVEGFQDENELLPDPKATEYELEDGLGPRQRKLTEKAQEERINQLRRRRTAALKAVRKKWNELFKLMTDAKLKL